LIQTGTVFFLNPGQSHHWTFSNDTEGIIFFHAREFFDKNFTKIQLRDYAFFDSVHDSPFLKLKKGEFKDIKSLFEQIKVESRLEKKMKDRKILSLVNLLYIALARLYVSKVNLKSGNYLTTHRVLRIL